MWDVVLDPDPWIRNPVGDCVTTSIEDPDPWIRNLVGDCLTTRIEDLDLY